MSNSKVRFLESLDRAGMGAEGDNKPLHKLMSDLFDTLDKSDESAEDKLDCLTLLSAYLKTGSVPSLASLHSTPKRWTQFHLGVYSFGTKLRVKANANLTGSSLKYRGQEGVFSYVANGKVFIEFHDDRFNRGPMFLPDDLEAQV